MHSQIHSLQGLKTHLGLEGIYTRLPRESGHKEASDNYKPPNPLPTSGHLQPFSKPQPGGVYAIVCRQDKRSTSGGLRRLWSVITLHNLIGNKMTNSEVERQEKEGEKKKAKKEKEKEAAGGKGEGGE